MIMFIIWFAITCMAPICQSTVLPYKRASTPSRLIILEEHFERPGLGNGTAVMQQILSDLEPDTLAKLKNLSAGRLADMDAGHVSVQVLSSISMGDTLPLAVREVNSQLAAVVGGHPDRFRSSAALPMAYLR